MVDGRCDFWDGSWEFECVEGKNCESPVVGAQIIDLMHLIY